MDASEALEALAGQHLFLATDPDVLDFTDKDRSGKIIIGSKQLKLSYPLPKPDREFRNLMSKLRYFLTYPGIVIIGWNIKSFLSYYLFRVEKPFDFGKAKVIDLKLLEAFVGIKGEQPRDYNEANVRLAKILKMPSWEKIQKAYKKIHHPLATEVVPAIETAGLVHGRKKETVYPCYEIEGQVNGRMRCDNGFIHCFNPHTMGEGERAHLRARDGWYEDYRFLYLDFRHMEVNTLQWLSRDPVLWDILESGEDLYKIIWERITSITCNDLYREKCKLTFLPVAYGQGFRSVAQRLKVKEEVAERLVRNIYRNFPTSMSWLKRQQETLDPNNFAFDYFGRRRRFDDQTYRIRNFVVQSPASIVCLHKLIRLHRAMLGTDAHLVFHVHDGYGMIVHRKNSLEILKNAKEVLESSEDFYPDLKLQVTAQMGCRLDTLETIPC